MKERIRDKTKLLARMVQEAMLEAFHMLHQNTVDIQAIRNRQLAIVHTGKTIEKQYGENEAIEALLGIASTLDTLAERKTACEILVVYIDLLEAALDAWNDPTEKMQRKAEKQAARARSFENQMDRNERAVLHRILAETQTLSASRQ